MEELTSIIVVTRDHLDYTRDCLRSIGQYTPQPYELILVDNASADSSVDYLRTVPHAQVIGQPAQTSYAACVNRAMDDAIGDYVMILDPACFVTAGWLERLIAGLRNNPRVAAVGPMTNVSLSNPVQNVDPTYTDLQGIPEFARQIAEVHGGQTEEVKNLSLFCWLMTQEAMEKGGALDDNLNIFAAQDYSLRMRLSGFKLRMVKDVFVHRSYITPWTEDDFKEDDARFRAKWAKVRDDLKQREAPT
jgi:GT2 family glycosyltransferase